MLPNRCSPVFSAFTYTVLQLIVTYFVNSFNSSRMLHSPKTHLLEVGEKITAHSHTNLPFVLLEVGVTIGVDLLFFLP